jgi:hypothetical protein
MLKNILFLLFVAIALQACGGKDVEFETDLDLNFEADLDSICESQSFNVDAFKVKSTHYGTQLEQVEVQLATLKEEYSSDDACIPFSVVATNKGADPIYLTDEQLVQLNSNSIGLYGKGTRVFAESLVPVEDNPILHGEPWQPGVQLEFAAFIKFERIKLYAPSYFTDTNKVLDASFQGPSTLLGMTKVNALVTVDPANFTTNEVVVGFNDGVDLSQAEAIIAASGSAIKSTIISGSVLAILVIIPPDKSIDAMINYFELDPSVKYAQRNDIVTLGRL